ncbi:hypothetical protein N9M10_00405 [Hellea sp.]|nr:hypothetical protein [Hellea sp.]
MNMIGIGVLGLVVVAGAGYFYGKMESNPAPSEKYVKSKVYTQCDRDYLQSARHLGFSASKKQCVCFDKALQALTPGQSKAAYKSLEDRLTLAFMGKAGAKVKGTNVSIQDDVLGTVTANVKVNTSGASIIKQCNMF